MSCSVQVDTTGVGESSADFDVDVHALLAQREPVQAALLASAAGRGGASKATAVPASAHRRGRAPEPIRPTTMHSQCFSAKRGPADKARVG